MSAAIPTAIQDWLNAHKGFRQPVHAPGKYQQFATSRSSTCWGSHGGIAIDSQYRIAVCTPSPNPGATPVMLFDFIQSPAD